MSTKTEALRRACMRPTQDDVERFGRSAILAAALVLLDSEQSDGKDTAPAERRLAAVKATTGVETMTPEEHSVAMAFVGRLTIRGEKVFEVQSRPDDAPTHRDDGKGDAAGTGSASHADAGLCAELLEAMIAALEELAHCERPTWSKDSRGRMRVEELARKISELNEDASDEELMKALMIAGIGFDMEPERYVH